MKYLYYYLFRFFLFLFKNTSFWFLYQFSNFFFILLFYLFRYRKNVVFTNLRESFPDAPEEEIYRIAKGFYKHLCDISVEGVKAFSISEKEILARYKLMNPEFFEPYFQQKQSIIAVLGHYNNWEWGSLAAGLQIKLLPVAFYKALSNQLIDDYIQRTRAKWGTQLVSILQTTAMFRKYMHMPSIFVMVADQNPGNLKKAIWVPFLNHQTATLHGPEKHALENNLPVVFVDVQKPKRGFYTAMFSLLVEDPSVTGPGEITRMFMQRLEDQIKAQPEYWLWSHRRWKHNRVK